MAKNAKKKETPTRKYGVGSNAEKIAQETPARKYGKGSHAERQKAKAKLSPSQQVSKNKARSPREKRSEKLRAKGYTEEEIELMLEKEIETRQLRKNNIWVGWILFVMGGFLFVWGIFTLSSLWSFYISIGSDIETMAVNGWVFIGVGIVCLIVAATVLPTSYSRVARIEREVEERQAAKKEKTEIALNEELERDLLKRIE